MHWKDSGGGDFEQAPLGSHLARCIALIDLGTQNGPYGAKRQVLIRWELPDEKTTRDGKEEPFTVGSFFTQSLSDKANLRAMLKSWRGRDFTEQELAGFDAKNILSKPCMVSIIEKTKQNGSVGHVVSAVTAVPRNMTVAPQFHPSLYISLEPGEYDAAAFGKLSEKMQDMIKESPEWKKLSNASHEDEFHGQGITDDDIPF